MQSRPEIVRVLKNNKEIKSAAMHPRIKTPSPLESNEDSREITGAKNIRLATVQKTSFSVVLNKPNKPMLSINVEPEPANRPDRQIDSVPDEQIRFTPRHQSAVKVLPRSYMESTAIQSSPDSVPMAETAFTALNTGYLPINIPEDTNERYELVPSAIESDETAEIDVGPAYLLSQKYFGSNPR